MKTTAQILRDYRGPALFSFGFRPFFLFAALWAVITIPLWLLSFLGIGEIPATIFTRDWHVHEMLFGYTAAVIVGYMTVAGANWTGSTRPATCVSVLCKYSNLQMQ
ncbi:NnrS family protein [Sinorhizobium meliloti]|uniref:NnrS family protein n=1 Tax=Rhizobium meliloti TaxID=382 RepID=UPI001F308366|nr:NnrS family protein [Sinorhizobium meliloti]